MVIELLSRHPISFVSPNDSLQNTVFDSGVTVPNNLQKSSKSSCKIKLNETQHKPPGIFEYTNLHALLIYELSREMTYGNMFFV